MFQKIIRKHLSIIDHVTHSIRIISQKEDMEHGSSHDHIVLWKCTSKGYLKKSINGKIIDWLIDEWLFLCMWNMTVISYILDQMDATILKRLNVKIIVL